MCSEDYQRESLELLRKIATSTERRSVIDQDYVVSATKGFFLDYKNRKHLYVWAPNGVTFIIPDLGGSTLTAQADTWTNLSFRPGLQLFASAAQVADLLVKVRATDDVIVDDAITAATGTFVAGFSPDITSIAGNTALTVPGVQGWIAVTGTGTSGQDDPLTFASQVRIIALYNASANPIPLEFDAVAAATSFPIPPGAFWIFDNVRCTVLHVFPSATLPINTTAGLYVKGWK